MFKKLQLPTLTASLRLGGFLGWCMTVMYICEQSLHYYRDESLLASVNITFLATQSAFCAALVVVLLLLDFDGVLSHKLLRWLPGVFMAECGVALSLANADTMTLFSAFAGMAAAFGALAVMTHLLAVKVGQRIFAISGALAIGGLIRLLAGLLLSGGSQGRLFTAAIAAGVVALLTIHSRGVSGTKDGPLVSLAEAEPRTIISNVPFLYIGIFICCTIFYLVQGHTESLALSKLTVTADGFDRVSMVCFILAAVLAALFVKLPRMPMLFIIGTGLAASAAMLAGLPYLTAADGSFYAIMSYGGAACFKVCILLFIIIFSLDRPHPLFYAMFGYCLATVGELTGAFLDDRITTLPLPAYMLLMLALIPFGGILLAVGLRRHGFSSKQLEHRRNTKLIIRKRSEELELFERERLMVESIVLDGFDIDRLASKLLFSRNTVRVLLRPVYEKLEVSGIDELRDYFAKLTENEEQFIAQVQAAEDHLRAEQRRERNQERINSLRDKYERLDAARAEKQRLKAARAEHQPEKTDQLPQEQPDSADDIILGAEVSAEGKDDTKIATESTAEATPECAADDISQSASTETADSGAGGKDDTEAAAENTAEATPECAADDIPQSASTETADSGADGKDDTESVAESTAEAPKDGTATLS